MVPGQSIVEADRQNLDPLNVGVGVGIIHGLSVLDRGLLIMY